MPVKIYGPKDENPELLRAVLQLLGEDSDATIAMFSRAPLNARVCQYPGRLRFEIVVEGRAYAAYQNPDGSIELPQF